MNPEDYFLISKDLYQNFPSSTEVTGYKKYGSQTQNLFKNWVPHRTEKKFQLTTKKGYSSDQNIWTMQPLSLKDKLFRDRTFI